MRGWHRPEKNAHDVNHEHFLYQQLVNRHQPDQGPETRYR